MDNAHRNYDEKVLDLLRAQLGVLKLDNVVTTVLGKTDSESLLELYKFSDMILKSPFWKMILKEVIEAQKNYAVMQAENYNLVTFARAQASGAALIDELLKRLQIKYVELAQPVKDQLEKKDQERYDLIGK
jgi:hypothetical protein